MKTLQITLLFLIFSVIVTAQESKFKSTRTSKYDPTIVSGIHKVSILPLGYAYERRLAEEFTIESGVDFSFDTYFEDIDNTDQYAFVVNPTLHAEPRYYYNLQRRYARGRNVNFNAANYIGVYSELRLNPLVKEFHGYWPVYDRFKIGPAWGFQRNLGRRGYLNFNFAYGLVIDIDGHASYEAFSRLTLGIRLNGVVEK